jgi:hypothetical protein
MKAGLFSIAAMAPASALAHPGHGTQGSLLHSLGHGGEPLMMAVALAGVAGWLLYRARGR